MALGFTPLTAKPLAAQPNQCPAACDSPAAGSEGWASTLAPSQSR